ncbi:MAG: PQQ-dependent sugar dehydrogenase [Pseudonocardiaceae bacterium]
MAIIAIGVLLLPGCARFDDTAAGGAAWQPAPELTPEQGPQPELPEVGGTGSPGQRPPGRSAPQTSIPPPEGCTDHDPAVIGTCMDTISAVAAFPGDGTEPAALAAERTSGRILRVTEGAKPSPVAKLTVDADGDGGLTGLALSPSYHEDQLVFAYITTAEDNRVVRFAAGQEPTPVLTGIPKGRTGNRGALADDGKGFLLVATGDAGDPGAAADPKSLAGKVLRIDGTGEPAPGNPTAGSPIIASGLHSPGGLCTAPDGSRSWVTDRGRDSGALYRLEPGEPLGTPAWRWEDKPGIAGCVDWSDMVGVAMSTAGNMQNLSIADDGSVTSKPQVIFDGKASRGFGRLSGMDLLNEQLAVVGTVNKDGGRPVSSDDRVIVIARPPDAGGGKD